MFRSGKQHIGGEGFTTAMGVAGGVGTVLFVCACFTHSRTLGFTGIGLIVVATLSSVRVFMRETNKGSHLLDIVGSAWAILFAVYLVAAVFLPFARQFWLPAGFVIVAGFFTLAFFFWRNERTGPRH